MERLHHRAHPLLIHAACLIGCLVTTTAAAEDIDTVTMTRTGPDKVLPLGKSFFLAGKVGKHTAEFQPIFVRISYPALGAHVLPPGPRSCDEAKDVLGERKEAPEAPVGEKRISDLWSGEKGTKKEASDKEAPVGEKNTDLWSGKKRTKKDVYRWLSTWHNALALTPWKRQPNETGEQEFKILVAGSSFFRPGARYCLFFYEKNRLQEEDKRKVKAALLTYAQGMRNCPKPEGAEHAACEKQHADQLFGILDELTAEAPAARRENLRDAVKEKLVDAASKLSLHPEELKLLSERWHTVFNVPDPTKHEPDPIVPAEIKDNEPLARLVATMMVRAGTLLAIPHTASGASGGLRYYTPDGKLEVKYLNLLEGFQGVRLLADEKKDKHRIDQTTLDKYVLPDSTVTLLDLLEFSRGRIRVDKSYLPIGEAYSKVLKDSTGFAPGEVDPRRPPETLPRRNALMDQVASLQQVLERGWKANSANGAPREVQEVPAKDVYKDVGQWLSKVLAHCEDLPEAMRAAYGKCASKPEPAQKQSAQKESAKPSDAWPGFNKFTASPLGLFNTRLAEYRAAEELWAATTDRVVNDLERESERTPREETLDLKLGYTQSTWFFSYVTPVVGNGFVFTHPGAFNLSYIGAQLYFWPNEINEPMWTNGWGDLRRVLALEAAVGLAGTQLGSEGRFSGAAGLPPLFLGASLQVLPYATLSGGWVLLGARRSTLPQESPGPFVANYLSLTVQANIPELFKKVVPGGGTATLADVPH